METLKGALHTAGEKIKEGGEYISETFKPEATAEGAKEKISEGFQHAHEGIQEGLHTAKEDIHEGFQHAQKGFEEGVEAGKKNTNQGVENVKEKVKGKMDEFKKEGGKDV